MNLEKSEPDCHKLNPRSARHWRLTLLLLAILILRFRAGAAACVSTPDGLVGWWPGDGNTTDLAGTNNGIWQGGATADGAGVDGSAFTFDGTNSYVQFPDSPVFHPANLTVEAWVRFSGLNSAGNSPAGQQYIVFKQNTRSGTFEGFALTKSRSSGRDYFDFQVSSSSGVPAEILSATAVTSNVWYHVAAVRGSNFIQIYVNGQLENQMAVTFAQDYGALPLFFGTSGQPSWDHKFKGLLDEVSLYNRALSSNEVAAIYGAGADGKCKAGSPPNIGTQPESQTVAAGADVAFSVAASGTAPLSYQWQRNGVDLVDSENITGANSNLLALLTVQTNDSANFQVIITNAVGAVTSAVAVLTVDPTWIGPSITTQPANQAVSSGDNVTFTVGAAGSTPLSYQWRFNGTNIANGGQFTGATSSALGISFAFSGDAGGYSVVVTNAIGSVTSAVATLTVNPASGCLPSPAGLVGWWAGDGSANDLTGTNNGIFRGGANANAAGVNGSAFHFDGTNDYVEFPDSPVFHPAALTVECWVKFDAYQTPGDTLYPYQQYIVFKQTSQTYEFEGFALTKDNDPQGNVFLWEVASVNHELVRIDTVNTVVTGAWYHVAGVRGSNYTQLYMNGHLEVQAAVAFPQDYGSNPMYFGTSGQSYYDRRLHGSLDEVGLYNRALSANEIAAIYAAGSAGRCKGPIGASIFTQPQSQTVVAGSNAHFTTAATGAGPLGYQWRFNGAPIAGGSGTNLTVSNAQPADAGDYTVVVTNSVSAVTSVVATLTVLVPPTISNQPTNHTAPAGASVTFEVTASGTEPLNYQWRSNGMPIAGAEGTTLTLSNVQSADEAGYTVVVTNSAGSVTSTVATLMVLVRPSITTQPANRASPVGATVNFSVAAAGTEPLTYQWQYNGTNLDGALGDTLNLTNLQLAQAGNYRVGISNAAGTTNSAIAVLTVVDQPVLLNARMSNGAFVFTLSGVAGQNYIIDVSTNLPNWIILTPISNATPQTDFTDSASAESASRFYRARWVQ